MNLDEAQQQALPYLRLGSIKVASWVNMVVNKKQKKGGLVIEIFFKSYRCIKSLATG